MMRASMVRRKIPRNARKVVVQYDSIRFKQLCPDDGAAPENTSQLEY